MSHYSFIERVGREMTLKELDDAITRLKEIRRQRQLSGE